MNDKATQSGLGIVSVLTAALVLLKLFKLIKWRWVWVLSPLWISAGAVILLFSGILVAGRIKKGKW